MGKSFCLEIIWVSVDGYEYYESLNLIKSILARSLIILIRLSHSGSWMFTRNNTESIGEVLTRKEDCSVLLHVEKQGESIAFKYNNMGFFTTSEGKTPPIYYYHFIWPRQ